MKKILFMINSLDSGGAERVLINLLNHLPVDKFEITLVTVYSSNGYEKYLSENIKYKYLFKKKGKIFNRIMLSTLCRIIPKKILYRWIFKEKFDYEIAYLQGFPTELIRASSNSNSQKIAFVHSDFSTNYDVEKLYRSTNDCLNVYRTFDKVCFVSQSALDGFYQKIGTLNNSYVVHNVLDTQFILEQARQAKEIAYQENTLRIITVGRLVKLKALDRLILAIERIKEDFSGIECFIIGDGPEKEKLQTLAKQKQLENEIIFLGQQNNPYKYVKEADIYVCTSLTEGYSTSVIEALVLGVPILTTKVSGMEEIIGDTNSGLIVDNSYEGIYTGLRTIFSNKDILKTMKEAAIKRGKAFQTEIQVDAFIKMLET